jgi:hypothetical protein
MAGALLAALAGAPSIARAGGADARVARPAAVAELAGEAPASGAPGRAAPGEVADYAAREAASPQLGNFAGGRGGIYIGGGTVVVVLLVVLIILLI